jgi:hypothetical protein
MAQTEHKTEEFMELTGLLEELRITMEQYRLSLKPGLYLFAPELRCGKMTGRIIEDKSDNPSHIVKPDELGVTFAFCPLGFLPASLKGAPPSWLSGYPLLRGMEKLTEAPKIFLELLKLHVEERMAHQVDPGLPAGRCVQEKSAAAPEISPLP